MYELEDSNKKARRVEGHALCLNLRPEGVAES